MSDVKSSLVVMIVIACLIAGGVFGAFVFPREVQVDGTGTNATDCPECPGTTPEDCPECPECKTEKELEKEAIITGGYLLDELFLGSTFSKTLSDREIYLFDDEVKFDGDDYDAEEIFTLTNLNLSANKNDFDGNVYLTIPENGISYVFRFEPSLNTSTIEDDETLQFNFLGEDITISEWDVNEVTLTQGEKYFLDEEESIVVNGKDITLELVLNDVVYVSVNGESKAIHEGVTRTIEGIEIKAEDVLYDTRVDRKSKATLIIGENIEMTISDGDEYEEDSIWKWVINKNSIGLIMVEEFVTIEEESNNALAPEETLCLPNNYVCVRYNGLIGQDNEEYDFDMDNSFVRVKGNFLNGTKEYDKVYINSTGIYDDDNNGILIGTTVELGDTDSILNISTGSIVIEDFTINLDLNVTNVGDDDADYRTNYGIFIEDPEDSCDNQEFTITVPEEKLEGIMTVKKGGFEETEEEPVCDVNHLELCLDEATCVNATGYWYSDVCNVEEEPVA